MSWRADPVQSGPVGCLDIGAHAFSIASFVPARHFDDNVQILFRFERGSRVALWASQVAVGQLNGLRLRVFGDKGGLEWDRRSQTVFVSFSLESLLRLSGV